MNGDENIESDLEKGMGGTEMEQIRQNAEGIENKMWIQQRHQSRGRQKEKKMRINFLKVPKMDWKLIYRGRMEEL